MIGPQSAVTTILSGKSFYLINVLQMAIQPEIIQILVQANLTTTLIQTKYTETLQFSNPP